MLPSRIHFSVWQSPSAEVQKKQNNKLGTFGSQPFHIPAYTRRDGILREIIYVYSGVTANFVRLQTKEK